MTWHEALALALVVIVSVASLGPDAVRGLKAWWHEKHMSAAERRIAELRPLDDNWRPR